MISQAGDLLRAHPGPPKTLYLATSNEKQIVADTQQLTKVLAGPAGRGITWHYAPLPQETHGTIYHPAALKAFRLVFKPLSSAH